jgi:hypothetical protein
MNQDRKWVLILFFPVTAYMFLGTTLLFLLYKVEQVIEALGDFSEFPGFDGYQAIEWHNESIWLTVIFPILWPVLAVWESVVFTYAVFSAILRFIYNILVSIWKMVVAITMAIWNWAVESIEYVWETIIDFFHQDNE